MLTIAAVAVLVVLLSLVFYGVVKGARGSDYATIAVPGEATIQLEPGTISLTYREAKNYATPTGIRFDEPPELRVEVTSETGDGPLEIKRVGVMGTGGVKAASSRGFTRKLLGTVSIPASGLYTVRATPELPNAVEPQIIVGD